MQNKVITALIGALAIVSLGLSLSKSKPVVVQQPAPLGSVASNDLQSTYLRVGGVMHEYRSSAMKTGTTTVCVLGSPSATSTLIQASARVGTATSTATTWTIAKNTSGGSATTTLINNVALSSGAQGAIVASTTAYSYGVSDPSSIFAPNTYLVWGVAGIIYNAQGTIDFGGACEAEFVSI